MKKVTIEPANSEIKTTLDTLRLKNDFISLGFKSRAAFINIVQEYNDKYVGYQMATKLERWWVMRYKDNDLNIDLEIILNKLRHE